MKSLRAAINAKCKDCIYDPKSGLGTWREQISRCVCVDCPLWPHRTGPESGPYIRSKMDAELSRDSESGRRVSNHRAGSTTPQEAA